MPNYLLVSIIILLNVNFSYSQYEKRKIGVDKASLERIAKQKTDALKDFVTLTPDQYSKIKNIYKTEAVKIDSMKFLPPEFYEDPMQSREMILDLKQKSEEAIFKVLSQKQKNELTQKREKKRREAFEKLQNKNDHITSPGSN